MINCAGPNHDALDSTLTFRSIYSKIRSNQTLLPHGLMCFKEKTIKLPNNSSVYKFYSFPAKTII